MPANLLGSSFFMPQQNTHLLPSWETSAPVNRTVPGATPAPQPTSSENLLSQLYETLASASGPTSTVRATTTTAANRSPALEQDITGFMTTLQGLADRMQEVYSDKAGTFDDLINSVRNAYRQRGGDLSSAAQSGALASGLTPLEATSLGQESTLEALRQMFPQLAQLRSQQADVPIALQEALAELQTSAYLPLLSQVVAPYRRGVAGTVTEGTESIEDLLGRQGVMANILGNLGGLEQGRADMTARLNEAAADRAWRSREAAAGREFALTEGERDRLFRRGEREASQEFTAEENERTRAHSITSMILEDTLQWYLGNVPSNFSGGPRELDDEGPGVMEEGTPRSLSLDARSSPALSSPRNLVYPGGGA